MRFLITALLRLYPERFRRSVGPDLLAAFDDSRAERRGLRQAVRTMADLARGGLRAPRGILPQTLR
jgi:hypothetical protein